MGKGLGDSKGLGAGKGVLLGPWGWVRLLGMGKGHWCCLG